MDRNWIIGFILIALILGLYTCHTTPGAEEQARARRTQDSLAQVALEQRAREAEEALKAGKAEDAGSTSAALAGATLHDAVDTTGAHVADSLRRTELGRRYGIFLPA